MSEFLQGVCLDGAAILCDGKPLTPEQILMKLREAENTNLLYEYEIKERMRIFSATLRSMTNGEWDELRKFDTGLHEFIKQAVNRPD